MRALTCRIEAILFTRDEAVSVTLLAQALQVTEAEVTAALTDLAARYEDSAMMLVALADGWRLQLRPPFFEDVTAFSETQPVRFSRAFWETLAYIAYHQPVTRAEIDAVRGVTTSSGIYRQLFELEWVEVIGTKEVPGRPELLATTRQFLNDFSVASLEDLPPLPDDEGLGGFDER
ncbi:MAG: SMC-Scp complex subunit ScpB [Cardiobacteriaceae bacterium]|nr:SMC-Scp complex subunit ScpB [Cardiobacteriaceae bacterium]